MFSVDNRHVVGKTVSSSFPFKSHLKLAFFVVDARIPFRFQNDNISLLSYAFRSYWGEKWEIYILANEYSIYLQII